MSELQTSSMCENNQTAECFHPLVDAATAAAAADSDSNSSYSDHSEINEDVMRLVNSTRKLLRTSSQECAIRPKTPFIRFGSNEDLWTRKSTLSHTRSDPVQLITADESTALIPSKRCSMGSTGFLRNSNADRLSGVERTQCKPVSLQNLRLATLQTTTDPALTLEPEKVRMESYNNHKAMTEKLPLILSSLQPKADVTVHKSLEKLKPESCSTIPTPICYMQSHMSNEKLDVETPSTFYGQVIPDFCPGDRARTFSSTSGPSSVKRTKIGLPFFRPKQASPNQSKSVQMKELKRMIRAGKPSYEQIHSWGHSFETLLNDRFGLALFKEFLSTEFSDENIEFWIACQEYKQISNPKKLAARAQRIFAEFIAVQANREVNLDSKTRLQTEADLANPTIHTLDNAQKRIQALMEKDSYRRFLRSEVYMTLYTEAREVAKAAAASALAASLQQASDELDGAVLNLVNSTSSNSPFSFLSNFSTGFTSPLGPGLHLPGVAAAAASAEAGMNSVQDLQLLGLSTSRHMRGIHTAPGTARTTHLKKSDTAGACPVLTVADATIASTTSYPTTTSTNTMTALCDQENKVG